MSSDHPLGLVVAYAMIWVVGTMIGKAVTHAGNNLERTLENAGAKMGEAVGRAMINSRWSILVLVVAVVAYLGYSLTAADVCDPLVHAKRQSVITKSPCRDNNVIPP
jgi:hypothetical protein